MNGPGFTNTVIVAVVVFLVVSLGAGVFFWWRSMYGVWSLKRRQNAAQSPDTTADGSPIVIIPGAFDAAPAPHSGHGAAGRGHRAPGDTPAAPHHHHHTATDADAPWAAPDHAGHDAGGHGGFDSGGASFDAGGSGDAGSGGGDAT